MAGMAIGIVSDGRKVELLWAATLGALIMNTPVGIAAGFVLGRYNNQDDSGLNPYERVAHARQGIVERALEMKYDWLFFLDDDTIPPPETLKLLHYQLANDPEAMVCGGIYCTREALPTPLVFKNFGAGPSWDWKAGEVFGCEGLGAGCMLIRTEVFQKIEKPWFKCIKDATSDLTEDSYFCLKVLKAGFKILAHGGVLPAHVGQDGKIYTLPRDSYPFKPVETDAEKAAKTAMRKVAEAKFENLK